MAPNDAASRFLSYLLRHRPDSIGLQLDAGGWAIIDDLVRLSANSPTPLSATTIAAIVQTNDKQRFVVSPDGTRVRANQGHSVDIDLELAPTTTPPVLFHGTAQRFLASIERDGLQPRGRQHVHLSRERATALTVGRRHGRPVVLRVDAAALHAAGQPFFVSANGVWLVAAVPPPYLQRDDDGA
jgi:putative RNA 2'-phosphotransferase